MNLKKLAALAVLVASCSNDNVPDLPPSCEGSGYYEIETHYCHQEVREINAGGKNCIITSAEEDGHTYEINCEGRSIGYLDNGKPGEKGENGLNGANGENCSVTNVSLGVEITCATMTVPLHGANGKDGADGKPGTDGIDGTDGKDGIDGQNCTIAQKPGIGVEITCGKMELLRHGKDGENGTNGTNGTINGENCTIAETDDDGWEIKCGGVSLNGKKGDEGDPGAAGEDCKIEIKSHPSEGVEITCGTVKTPLGHGENGTSGSVITINDDGYWCIDGDPTGVKAAGDKGEDGKGCVVEGNGAHWEMTCGDGTHAEWPKAMCMLTAYDPADKFCYENIIVPLCGGKAYDPATQLCHYGKVKQPIFTDERDGKKYAYVTIDNQIWMAQNLNYNATGGRCYGDDDTNCEKYGMLYNWSTAMDFAANCNTSTCSGSVQPKHQGICPSGWHLPSEEDWDKLMNYVQTNNGETYTRPDKYASIAGKYLKATSGWNSNGNGEDKYGFAALPGGSIAANGNFDYVGAGSDWWSTSEGSPSDRTYVRGMYYEDDEASWYSTTKSRLFSVRCVQDD